jgi:ribosomal-protein-alanine N-acetyltransferase
MLNHVGTKEIETERLLLRRYEMTDAEVMFRSWVTDPEVSRFWGWTPHEDIDETRQLLTVWINEYTKPDVYNWVIVLKSETQAIGYIYLNDVDDINDSVSIHYALSRKYWNKGIMTEAVMRVLEFAFTTLHANKIHTSHHVDNIASGLVMQKSGMRYVNTAYKYVPDREQISGDYCYYEITRSLA